MKRKIKFRFWDNKTKSFEYWDMSWGTNKLPVMTEFSDAINQFTGLHDKNGKEIYEGDILEYSCGAISGEVAVKYAPGHFYLDGYPFEENAMLNEKWFADKTEIIGNIYENKDLS